MSEQQQKCKHEWTWDDDWRDHIYLKNDMLYVPTKCSKCGKEADEIFSFDCTMDEKGEILRYAD